jgi:hypothetical protein
MRNRFRTDQRISDKTGSEPGNLRTALAAFITVVAVSVSPPATLANDTIASFAAGGIELLKTEHIRMAEEVLEISPKQVNVKYRFFNESDHDIHTLVAFPLPPFRPIDRYYSPVGEPGTILRSFKVLVNGKPVPTERVRKAVLGELDITDYLRKLGLPDKEIFFDDLGKNWEASVDRLAKFMRKLGDWWDISHAVFWQMTFPSKKEVMVEQQYIPEPGGAYSVFGKDAALGEIKAEIERSGDSSTDALKNPACLDDITTRAITNRVKTALAKGQDSVMVSYSTVEYILGTGRNWKGPIGDLTLRLKKENPQQFVSVCFPGKPLRISPTVYEFHQKDFVPPDTLDVYFYTIDSK